jgi:hypothetical protein
MVSGMLSFLTFAQLILFLALLFLLGQGVLWVLAGAKRDGNFVYQLFQIINKPWLKGARAMAPKQVDDAHVGFVAFFVVVVLYGAVTLARIEHCVSIGVQACR